MHCYLLGVSYKNTPIHIREKIFFSEYKKIQAIELLSDKDLDGVIILSTCNRCEVYISTNNIVRDSSIVKKFFMTYFDIENIDKYLFEKTDKDVIKHIFEVTSGLDSMILGEDQILGQVKDSLENSIQLGASSKYLNKLFREAITTAKYIKTEYKISQNPISISYIAVKMLCEEIDIKNKKIMIVGTGKIGLLAINYLIEKGAKDIICINRSYNKIQKIIEKYPFIKHKDYEDRYKYIKDMDIVITSTTSTHLIIRKDQMPYISKIMYMIDLSMPRDIDENIKSIDNIKLYDIDDISRLSEENMTKRKQISENVSEIIQGNIQDFEKWASNIKADSTLKQLNERCKEIQNDTMQYINRKVYLNHREKKIIEKMISSALKRLIKPSIVTLKNTRKDDIQRNIDNIKQVFELERNDNEELEIK